MPEFIRSVLYVGAAAAVAAAMVYWFRENLRPLASTRPRRVLAGIGLVVVQLVVGIIVASIDFGVAREKGVFTAEDQNTIPWLIGFTAIGVALEAFVLLHEDFAEDERARMSRVRSELDFQNLISLSFLKVVSMKRRKFVGVKDGNELLLRMKPNEQIAALVAVCWELINQLLKENAGTGHSLRVVYFRSCPGENRLSLAHSWNGTSDNVVRPIAPEKLDFADTTGCLAVAAAKTGVTYLIPDTQVEDHNATSAFHFFDKTQRNRLQSVAALPIKIDGDSPPHGVLMVDTDVKGFFHAERRLPLEQVIANLAHRLQLEEQLTRLPGVG